MPDRDSNITKFTCPSYHKLKKSLGEFDAVVECNELAIREFGKTIAESQGHFALAKNLRIQLIIERNLQGGSTLVPLKIIFCYSY